MSRSEMNEREVVDGEPSYINFVMRNLFEEFQAEEDWDEEWMSEVEWNNSMDMDLALSEELLDDMRSMSEEEYDIWLSALISYTTEEEWNNFPNQSRAIGMISAGLINRQRRSNSIINRRSLLRSQ